MGAYEFAAAFRVLRVEAASGRVFAPSSPIDIERIAGLSKLAANRRFEPLLVHAEARQSLLRLYLSVTYSEAGG
jgi:hypothetical protein